MLRPGLEMRNGDPQDRQKNSIVLKTIPLKFTVELSLHVVHVNETGPTAKRWQGSGSVWPVTFWGPGNFIIFMGRMPVLVSFCLIIYPTPYENF